MYGPRRVRRPLYTPRCGSLTTAGRLITTSFFFQLPREFGPEEPAPRNLVFRLSPPPPPRKTFIARGTVSCSRVVREKRVTKIIRPGRQMSTGGGGAQSMSVLKSFFFYFQRHPFYAFFVSAAFRFFISYMYLKSKGSEPKPFQIIHFVNSCFDTLFCIRNKSTCSSCCVDRVLAMTEVCGSVVLHRSVFCGDRKNRSIKLLDYPCVTLYISRLTRKHLIVTVFQTNSDSTARCIQRSYNSIESSSSSIHVIQLR